MNVVRWVASGLVFGIGPSLPNTGEDWVILLGAYLFILSAIIAIAARQVRDQRGRSLVGQLAMAGDALGGMAAVITFAPGPEWNVIVPVGVVLIGTGALRGGIGGSVATLATTVVAYLAGEGIRSKGGDPFEIPQVVLTLVAYAFAAVVFIGWHFEVRRLLVDRARLAARLTLVERIASDVVYEWDIAGGDITLSDAATIQLGYEVSHRRLDRAWWEERLHPDDAGPVRDALATVLREGGHEWEMDYRFRKADGTYTTVHDRGYVVLSGGRKRKPLRLVGSLVNVDSVSLYDPVTKLAGRALFVDRVERRAVRVALGTSRRFAVLVADIEGWRERSAQIGGERAEEVIVELARRLERYVREGETIARTGPDQIALLVNAEAGEDAFARAAQTRDSARLPFNGDLRLDVHVGAALLVDLEGYALLSQATAALADAKRMKRRVSLYEPGGEQRWDRRLEMRDDLRGALERREVRVSFQPIASAATGKCVAVEALVRWRHPELGEIDAADLLPVASDLELRAEIDRYVISDAAKSLAQLRRIDRELRISVNLSPAAFDEGIATTLRTILASSMLEGDALTIDVPEDPALEEGVAAQALKELRALNVGIAIDDVGTAYASTVLASIPATEVKIDRVFAARVTMDEQAEAIVRNTVARAHERGMRVVAEGVEDDATAVALRDLGVDFLQGVAIAEPMPLEAMIRWLDPSAPLPGASQGEAANGVDERLVLLREHALGEYLGSVPG
jgi:diguanylate cyclase (GGDEF)-like protein